MNTLVHCSLERSLMLAGCMCCPSCSGLQLRVTCLCSGVWPRRGPSALPSSKNSFLCSPACRSLLSSSSRLWTAQQQHLHCAASKPGDALRKHRLPPDEIDPSTLRSMLACACGSSCSISTSTGDHTGWHSCVQRASTAALWLQDDNPDAAAPLLNQHLKHQPRQLLPLPAQLSLNVILRVDCCLCVPAGGCWTVRSSSLPQTATALCRWAGCTLESSCELISSTIVELHSIALTAAGAA